VFNIKVESDKFIKDLKSKEQAIKVETAKALTFTAEAVQKHLVEEMKIVFDRPAPFTLRSLYKISARPNNLLARVFFKDFAGKGTPAATYLMPQVYGGPRKAKRSERALQAGGLILGSQFIVPGRDQPLNKYGNITQGKITSILSGLKASPDPYQNVTQRSRKRRTSSYFVIREDGTPTVIMERRGDVLRRVLAVTKQPTYRKRFRFWEISEEVSRQVLPQKLESAIRRLNARNAIA
jgi:hypothetical protein